MNSESTVDAAAEEKSCSVAVTISRWVNEPLPDIHGLLGSHDLARLTRRPRWLLYGLALIGKFPRKMRYHGRAIGWCRAEVLEWMTRGLAVPAEIPERSKAFRRCARRNARQACLPLECAPPCSIRRAGGPTDKTR